RVLSAAGGGGTGGVHLLHLGGDPLEVDHADRHFDELLDDLGDHETDEEQECGTQHTRQVCHHRVQKPLNGGQDRLEREYLQNGDESEQPHQQRTHSPERLTQ